MAAHTLSPSPDPVKRWALYALIVATSVALGAWTLWEPLGRDQGIHATIGAGLLNGQTTYSEIYNIKPPVTTAVHALSQLLFGSGADAIRWFDLGFTAASLAAMAALLLRLGYTPLGAILAPIGFAALYYQMSYWMRSQTDGWAGFLLIWGLLAMVVGWQNRRATLFLLSGAIFGLAFGLKYTIGGIALMIFAPLVTRDLTFRLKDFFAFALGGLGTLAGISATLAASGSLGAFIDIQQFTLVYASGFRTGIAVMMIVVAMNLWRAPFFAVAIGLGLWATATKALIPGRRAGPVILLLWVFAGALSFWAQGKGFTYHALPLLMAMAACIAPLTDLVTGWIARRDLTQATRRGLAILLAVATLISLPLARPVDWARTLLSGNPFTTSHIAYETPDFSVSANLQAVSILNDELQSGETLFVWGYETMLYYLTGRTPQHRYPYSWPFLVNYYDGRHDGDLLARLSAAPPTIFVVQNTDVTFAVTGRDIDSRTALRQWPELAGFLADNYRKIGESPRFEYYRLN